MTKKRNGLNNIMLVYHGCVSQNQTPLTFRQKENDIKSHISFLIGLGYTFVLPEAYAQWQQGSWTPDYPICCAHFDDGLESINLILPFMAGNNIPFGLALIGRRHRKKTPESDFISWAELSDYINTGLCEIMSHTHNMHHLTVGEVDGTSQPIMSGPPWVDTGIFCYIDPADTRPFWDWSHVDDRTLSFPLMGTDPAETSNPLPITSNIVFTPDDSITMTLIRFWVSNGTPAGAGYDVDIEVTIEETPLSGSETLIYTGTFKPKQYETRSQWVEREIATITLDASFALVSGTEYSLTFKTLNTGAGLLKIFTQPFIGPYKLSTDCRSVVKDKQGDLYIDYPPNSDWEARPIMIFGTGSGAIQSEAVYFDQIKDDLELNNQVVVDYLHATWNEFKYGFSELSEPLYVATIGGTYSNNVKVDNKFRMKVTEAHTAEVMALKFRGLFGKNYPMVVDCLISPTSSGPWTKVNTFIPGAQFFGWFEIEFLSPYALLEQDYWVRFETKSQSPFSGESSLMKIFLDIGDREIGAYYNNIEGSDIWASNYMLGSAFIKTFSRNAGVSAEQPKRMIYPFGAYNSTANSASEIKNETDISPQLKLVLDSLGLVDGHGVWPTANRLDAQIKEPALRHSKYSQARLLMYGDIDLEVGLNNLKAYAGALWQDVQHGGVKWQTSLEPDAAENATVANSYTALSYMAFDAWYFSILGEKTYSNDFDESEPLLYVSAAFGTYTDLEKVDSKFLFNVKKSHIAEKIRFKFATFIGTYYATPVDVFIGRDVSGPWEKVLTFTPPDTPDGWVQIDLNTEYHFSVGDYWVRFETKAAHTAQSLMRIYFDNIDTVDGAFYLQDEGSDVFDPLSSKGRAFIQMKSNETKPVYEGKLSEGGDYLQFDKLVGTLSAGQVISGPFGSATIDWFNGNPDNLTLKITGLSGTWAVGEQWSSPTATFDIDSIETINDEKTFLQSKGVKCLLIISNHNFGINDVDPLTASHVVNNYALYMPSIINAIVNGGWDGITLNIEYVPSADNSAATAFITALADEMHSRHLLCHMTAPAKTGTDYDTVEWTDWCDHAVLIKKVDAMKIMSYTESGPFSAAAPHAPTDFWNLVYFYLDTHLPARFKKRILCGCNAHSDMWDDANPGVDTYASYWDSLASGLLRGAMIETKDSEGYWKKYGIESYMGIPDTSARAVNEALSRRLGGVGSWKSDDGDIHSFFPKFPQIGRVKP